MAWRKGTVCLAYACLCGATGLLWQFLTVHYNYKGNWTALFYTGSYAPTPPALASEKIYTFPDIGYDGQYYHYVAHDPFLRKGMADYVDNPRLRWRRILVPGAAFLLARGRTSYIDAAFFAVTAGFLFSGSYWLGRYCLHYGLHPAWSLSFALVPGVLTSIDRMTIDIALAALCIGFALYAGAEVSWKTFPVLVLAPFARETGLFLILAAALFGAWQRQWRRALWCAAAALPYLPWVLFVHERTAPVVTVWLSYYPLSGIIQRTLEPVQFALAGRWLVMAAVFDYLGVLGIWVALAITARLVWRKSFGPLQAAIACETLLAIFVAKPDIWSGGYELGRTMSPLLVLLALQGVASRWWWNLLPVCMAVPRILWQLKPQWDRVVLGLLRGA